jgi:hypothetical protein
MSGRKWVAFGWVAHCGTVRSAMRWWVAFDAANSIIFTIILQQNEINEVFVANMH